MKSIATICVLLICATHIDAIINGYSAPQSPHHVYIFSMLETNVGIAGGGTLISSIHVLTAGNLVHNFVEWRCRLGSQLFIQTRQIVSVVGLAHPNYTPQPRNNDIGIVTLPANSILSFSVDISPIALPPLNWLQTLPFENEQGSMIGFGGSSATSVSVERLQRGHQRVTEGARCTAFFGVNSNNFFCGEDPIYQSNICNQDIGGGFSVSFNGVDTLVGISALVIEACNGTWPSAYTRVQPYREWIRSVTSV
ncbi:transmembrane protease serine 11G-like [Bradysia coprophila]|uniref:transmembrane protease serine 11G-like n=1 Tax=Bradysia coprophila TaxID=38358 RepID=UPI00187D6F38|nr:transmembrane protease serine 11G-like [Bradysia coprophila]